MKTTVASSWVSKDSPDSASHLPRCSCCASSSCMDLHVQAQVLTLCDKHFTHQPYPHCLAFVYMFIFQNFDHSFCSAYSFDFYLIWSLFLTFSCLHVLLIGEALTVVTSATFSAIVLFLLPLRIHWHHCYKDTIVP